jgi:hypothetical protein
MPAHVNQTPLSQLVNYFFWGGNFCRESRRPGGQSFSLGDDCHLRRGVRERLVRRDTA